MALSNSEKSRRWRERHPDRYMETWRRYKATHPDRVKLGLYKWQIRNKYGLSLDDFENTWLSQNGCCAICHTSLTRKRGGFAIDHDHTTGKTRSILCPRCNFMCGYLEKSLQWVAAATQYIETWKQLHNNSERKIS